MPRGTAEILSMKDLSRWMGYTSPSKFSCKIAIWAFLSTSGYLRGMNSTGYEIYETLIETWASWLKWVVCRVSTTNGSLDIDFGRFWSLLTQCGRFWPYWGIFEHVRLSDRYETYETLTETWSFWLKWGVYQVSTTTGSREIDFWPFWSLFMPFWPHVVPFDPIWAFLSTSGYLTGMIYMKH